MSLNDILQLGLEIRGLIPSRFLTKTIWERKVSWSHGGYDQGWGLVWICDVCDDHVVIKTGSIQAVDMIGPSPDYQRYTTVVLHAADPEFFNKIWKAVDKALTTI